MDEPATQAQLDALAKMRGAVDPGLTKLEASKLIAKTIREDGPKISRRKSYARHRRAKHQPN